MSPISLSRLKLVIPDHDWRIFRTRSNSVSGITKMFFLLVSATSGFGTKQTAWGTVRSALREKRKLVMPTIVKVGMTGIDIFYWTGSRSLRRRDAASQPGISERQAWRLIHCYQVSGAEGLVIRKCGQSTNRRLTESLKLEATRGMLKICIGSRWTVTPLIHTINNSTGWFIN